MTPLLHWYYQLDYYKSAYLKMENKSFLETVSYPSSIGEDNINNLRKRNISTYQ